MRRMFVIAAVAALGATLWGQSAAVTTPQAAEQRRVEALQQRLADWAQLSYYREANAAVPPPGEGEERVVFYGASIVEYWKTRGAFFPGKPYIDRGISGQTTAQMLVRFRQDVIDLKPAVVVILAGTNDIAGNAGPVTNQDIEANLVSLADLARANQIPVVLASILPVHNYTPEAQDFFAQRPMERINEVNRWLKAYCEKNRLSYLDYFSALVDEKGLLKKDLAGDGLHPNDAGYRIMAPLAEAAIGKAWRKR